MTTGLAGRVNDTTGATHDSAPEHGTEARPQSPFPFRGGAAARPANPIHMPPCVCGIEARDPIPLHQRAHQSTRLQLAASAA